MSKAFTRENDDDLGLVLDRPEREVSSYPNLVTQAGLAAIEGEVVRWRAAQAEAAEAGDREGVQRAAREFRYWSARAGSAQVRPVPPDDARVHFGSQVTLERTDGRRSTWRIVGEDEADPAAGRLSHASPLARAMMGRMAGEEVSAGAFQGEIIAIDV